LSDNNDFLIKIAVNFPKLYLWDARSYLLKLRFLSIIFLAKLLHKLYVLKKCSIMFRWK
jgi:hypothetical protein